MLAAGVNVAFGSDDVMDPWFPLGTASPLLLAHTGVVAAQMTGQAEIAETFAMVTERAARVLALGSDYGIEPGRPASFVVLPASSPMDAIRRQVRPRWVVAHGRVVATADPAPTRLRWLDGDVDVDFVRARDDADAGWREASLSTGGGAPTG
jgi:cytosine deaminase